MAGDKTHYFRFQSAEVNDVVKASGKLWGQPPDHIARSNIPKVKAFIGQLPPGSAGIEFTTDVEPDNGTPPGLALWSQGSPGVEIIERDAWVAIPVMIVKRQD